MVTGCSTIDEAVLFYKLTIKRMKEGGFLMRKWKSNELELIDRIERNQMKKVGEKVKDIKESELSMLGESEKVLGIG